LDVLSEGLRPSDLPLADHRNVLNAARKSRANLSGLFPRGEVAALFGLIEVDQVGIHLLRPTVRPPVTVPSRHAREIFFEGDALRKFEVNGDEGRLARDVPARQ